MAKQSNEMSGWVGWVAFASFMMMLVGLYNALIGLTALFNDEWVVVAPQNLLYFDLTTWGWVHLIMGLVVFFAGMQVLKGSAFARSIGVVFTFFSALASMATVDAYPLWSLIVLTVDIFVMYALIVHGGELKDA